MKNNKHIKFIKEYGILLLIIIGPIVGFMTLLALKGESSITAKQVHWHMPIAYDLCGNTTQLKDSGNHGILHGHDDAKIHIEGVIDTANRQETLGGFFDSANIVFSELQIAGFTNGDVCEGSNTPGKLRVEINGEENFDFRNFVLSDTDEIKIIFK
ncbi:hypothetical protein A9Q91_02765 [Candidatus Gracilibacteria bacterium 28_42_T64]|nr:hypothetical protein A9Q91_02765 [Candidatus Gracilibacteria bacterium 28_42_T64]